MTNRCHQLLGCCLALAVLPGCGGSSGPKLSHVQGKVTFAGQPVNYGSIEFVPDPARGGNGPVGYAEIVQGQYSTRQANGRGVIDGPHLVRITGYESQPVASNDENAPSTSQPLFSGYTINVDGLMAEKDFDVPESARGFDLFKTQTVKPGRNEP